MFAAARPLTPPARSAQRGGTLLGFMVGLVLGLSIAVVVAVFITQAPVPFVNKTNRAAERVTEPRTAAEAPDPNRPLNPRAAADSGRAAPPAVAPAPAPEAADASGTVPPNTVEDKASMLDRLFGKGAAESAGIAPPPAPAPAPAPQAAVKADARPADPSRADAARTETPREERSSYLLQAGAFRTQEDAEAMKAKLAFIGFEARVVAAEVNGQTMHRVRIGPYAQLDDMNRARTRLAENGIEASVVRAR